MFKRKYQLAVCIALLVVYCFAFQGHRKLFDPDEGRYSAIALHMLESGDWLIPRTHPEHPHLTKPPLAYWAIAGSVWLFGKNEFAVRFPNALAFFVIIILCYFLGRVFTAKRPWLVSLVFATFVFPATMCNGATTDYLLAMWETIAICYFVRAFWAKKEKGRFYNMMAMWVAFALAFLTKGPPGLLPLLSIIVFLQFPHIKKQAVKIYGGYGALILLFVGGGWFLALMSADHALLRYFVWDEFVLRIFTPHHARHASWYAAFYIFLPILTVGTFPWWYFVAQGSRQTLRAIRANIQSHTEQYSTSLFLILWFAIPLCVFVFARSKLPMYVLPLFVPLALVVARAIERRNTPLYKFRYLIALWCIMLVAVRPLVASLHFRQDSSYFADEIKKRYPYCVDEILFVDAVPAFGLYFYTGSEIKQVACTSADLQKEFAQNNTRLWLTPYDKGQEFRRQAAAHNIIMQEMGAIFAREEFMLFRATGPMRE